MSNLFIARVLSYDSTTKDAYVLVPQLQGSTPIIAQAYVNRQQELVDVPDLLPGDRALVFYDGGDTDSQAYWMTAGGAPVGGGGGGGDLEAHLAADNPHSQYVLTTALTSGYYSKAEADGLFLTSAAVTSEFYTQTQVNNIVSDYLSRAGGTMTGYITLHANPTANAHPATKLYVDNHINASNPHPSLQIALGSQTTGAYVATLTGTTNQITVTGSGAESATPVLALPQNIHVGATPTFSRAFLSQTGSEIPPMTVQSTAMVANLNANYVNGLASSGLLNWANHTNKPSPTVSVALTGAVSGSNSQIWTDLVGNVNISIATILNMGPGSLLNADLLDGLDSTHFLDASNLNAGHVPTARLNGPYAFDLTGALTGNASTATALQTTRTIAGKNFNGTQDVVLSPLTAGAFVTAGGTYDGSSARTFAVDATPNNAASKVMSRDADGDFAARVAGLTRLTLSQTTGTAPMTVSSTTRVDNLNADLLDGQHATHFGTKEEIEALLGDLLYVGLYDAALYDEALGTPKPAPVWDGGATVYRHAMYWVVASNGTLNFIDADLSGRYDIEDSSVSVANGDWIIAIDPVLGSPGHEVGTDQALGDMVFQYIPFSSETFVRGQIALHADEDDPHASAGYLKQDITDILYAPKEHGHDSDIEQYITQHEQRISYTISEVGISGEMVTVTMSSTGSVLLGSSVSLSFPAGDYAYLNGTYPVVSKPSANSIVVNAAGAPNTANSAAPALSTVTTEPHPYYLRRSVAEGLYAPSVHAHAEEIAAAIAAHQVGDPHPQYLTPSRGDNRYDFKGSVTAHAGDPLAHGDFYYTKSQADELFENTAAFAAHTSDPDPHPTYLQQDVAVGLYSALLHFHDDRYYTKAEMAVIVAEATPPEVIATDGAASSRVFVGDVTPADPQPGDLWVRTVNVALQVPRAPTAMTALALSESEIRVAWAAWPAASSVTGLKLQMSATGDPGTYSDVISGPPAAASLMFTVGGLDEDVRYWFRLAALNAATGLLTDEELNWSYADVFTQNLTPPPPTGLVVSAITPTGFRLAWTGPTWPDPGASDARYEVAAVGSTVVGFASGINEYYDFTGLTEVTSYQPKVRSVDRGGLRSAWAATTATTTNAAPPAPGAFTGAPTASTTAPTVSGTWTTYSPPIPDFAHYEVQLCRASDNVVLSSTTTTSVTWTSPEVAFGTSVFMRVRTVDTGGLTSAWVSSTFASTRADELIVPTISGGTPNDTITATWALPIGLDNFSGFELTLFTGDTLLDTVDLGSAATTHTWTDRAFGSTLRTKLRVRRSSGTAPATGGYSEARTMVADPIPSFSQSASENTVTTTVVAPAVIPTGFLRYAVELWVSGGGLAAIQYPTSPGDISFTGGGEGLAYSTDYVVRGRVERTGAQHGSYSTLQALVTTGPHPDTTPPVLPNITSLKPEGVYGRMWFRLTWPGGDDHAAIHVQRSINGGAWTDITFNTATRTTAFNLGDYAAGTTIRARARSRDTYDNWSAWATSALYTLVESPTYVATTATNSWRNTSGGEYNAAGNWRPYQGYFSTPSYNARGMMYYGEGIRNACANKTVTNINVGLIRAADGGDSGALSIHVVNHDVHSSPGRVTNVAGPHVYNASVLTTLARWPESGRTATVNLTLAQRNAFISGSAKGLGFYTSSGSPYVVMASKGDNGFQGLVGVFHYG